MRLLISRGRKVPPLFWCWSAFFLIALHSTAFTQAELSVDRDTIDFGTTQIGITRIDSFVIANVGSGLDSLSVEQILLIGDPGFSLSFPSTPFLLPKNQFVRVYVEFRSVDSYFHSAWAKVRTDFGIDSVVLIGGGADLIRVKELDSIYRLRFPPTKVGETANSSITLTAIGGDVTFTGLSSQDPDAPYFMLQVPGSGDIKLMNQEPTPLSFTYRPLSAGTHKALYQCQTDKGIFLIELEGEAFVPQQNLPFHPQLDTVSAHVGNLITMQFKADTALYSTDVVTAIELNLKYNPQSLWFQGVRSPIPNVDVTVEQVSEFERRVIFRNLGGGVITTDGKELLFIDWIGLSTAVPKNVVTGEITLIQKAITTTEETLGLVLLEGCTLGSEAFGRRVLILSVGIDPVGNELLIDYLPPDGVSGRLEVIDLLGESRQQKALDRGSGEEEKVRVNVEGLPRGLYAVRLEFADDVLLVPFVRP